MFSAWACWRLTLLEPISEALIIAIMCSEISGLWRKARSNNSSSSFLEIWSILTSFKDFSIEEVKDFLSSSLILPFNIVSALREALLTFSSNSAWPFLVLVGLAGVDWLASGFWPGVVAVWLDDTELVVASSSSVVVFSFSTSSCSSLVNSSVEALNWSRRLIKTVGTLSPKTLAIFSSVTAILSKLLFWGLWKMILSILPSGKKLTLRRRNLIIVVKLSLKTLPSVASAEVAEALINKVVFS